MAEKYINVYFIACTAGRTDDLQEMLTGMQSHNNIEKK
jgi:hypothetical protein